MPESEPIPDAALRALERRLEPSAILCVETNGAEAWGIDMKQLVIDFLALREAVRAAFRFDREMRAAPYSCQFESVRAIRALLPESSK